MMRNLQLVPKSLHNWKWTEPPIDEKEDNKELITFFQLRLISHVFSDDCEKHLCKVDNCSTMNAFLAHGLTCKDGRMENNKLVGCLHCIDIWSLLSLHARHCPYQDCRVPQCKELKQKHAIG